MQSDKEAQVSTHYLFQRVILWSEILRIRIALMLKNNQTHLHIRRT